MKKWLGGQYWTKTITYETDSNGKRRKIESNKLTKSDKNQGLCEAVVTLRDIVGVYKYHTYKDIQDILTAQIDRIGTALEYLETGPLKTAQIPDPANPTGQLAYVPMATGALKAQWDAYIKKKYTRVIADLEKTMDDIVPKLKKAKLARRGLLGAEKRGTGSTRGPLCGEEPDKTKMNKRIDYVIDAYEKKGTWKNPVA
ncbi:hypothetical protein CC80DRAFT_13256 [Byssothecium circinans]|uniref:Uncharacterized protein n=1 Tax=Byssothecium circinans TaxID=147558 RepID=A0A6A5URT9_9PLEO|nr:hypothetical protein CC80DRAFT_13256 [Byssothecium circinans]